MTKLLDILKVGEIETGEKIHLIEKYQLGKLTQLWITMVLNGPTISKRPLVFSRDAACTHGLLVKYNAFKRILDDDERERVRERERENTTYGKRD